MKIFILTFMFFLTMVNYEVVRIPKHSNFYLPNRNVIKYKKSKIKIQNPNYIHPNFKRIKILLRFNLVCINNKR